MTKVPRFTIERRTWARGGNTAAESAFLTGGGKRCCLGFYAMDQTVVDRLRAKMDQALQQARVALARKAMKDEEEVRQYKALCLQVEREVAVAIETAIDKIPEAVLHGKRHVTIVTVTDAMPTAALVGSTLRRQMADLGWKLEQASGLASNGLDGATDWYLVLPDVT